MSVETFETVIHECGQRNQNGDKFQRQRIFTFVREVLQNFRNAFKLRRQQRIDRDAFSNLLALDDRSLADIGVTRDQVIWASKLPLSVNAALEIKALKATGNHINGG
ncbi:MAG: DUF1127 domain-containing protein [Pseudomonadota bacterium]